MPAVQTQQQQQHNQELSSDDDEDVIIAEYDVYITPELQEQIYLLQFPTRLRDSPYNAQSGEVPQAMRIKPSSGFMELDIGMSTTRNFDKRKGVTWGEAVRSAREAGTDSFGLSSGFGKGVRTNEVLAQERAQMAAAAQASSEDRVENLLGRFDEVKRRGNVMNVNTLGGQIILPEEGKPMYMLGAFQGDQLHLSQVNGVAQLRPQFHHIDARAQLSKARQARERAANEPVRMNEPRLVQQMARTAADDEEINIAQTSAFLSKASEEKWIPLQYHDDEVDEAWATFGDVVYMKDTENAKKLIAEMTNEEYLDAISVPRIEAGSNKKQKMPLSRKQRDELEDEADDSE